MEDRFRKPQTAAGSEPKSRKTTKRLPPAKKTLVSKSDLGRPLPKASNSSRIRAQVPQNRNRKNCRNVAYKTHSKEKDKKRLPPAKKTLVSKSDLGRPLPKASNSSRIRAQVTQNRKPQKLPKRRIQNPLKRKRQEKIASSKDLTLEDRFRKPQTAAGFEPKSRKTATAKTAATSLTKPTQKKETRKD